MARRTLLLATTSAFIGVLVSIVGLELLGRVLPVSDAQNILAVNDDNPYLRFEENRDITLSSGYNFSTIRQKHINNYGFFSDDDYDPDSDAPLLAVIGDSYVEAVQVSNSHSVQGILAETVKPAGRVYSFGISGSPLSTYLTYARLATREFGADALVFVVIANDFDESLMKYKRNSGMHYFAAATDDWELIRTDYEPSRVKALFRRSALARYLYINLQLGQRLSSVFDRNQTEQRYVGNTSADASEERLSDSKKVVDNFLAALPSYSGLGASEILFVLDGTRPELYDENALEATKGSYFDLMRRYFATAVKSRGYSVIDLQPAFMSHYASNGSRFESSTDAHWNEAGHALVADEISQSAVFERVFQP